MSFHNKLKPENTNFIEYSPTVIMNPICLASIMYVVLIFYVIIVTNQNYLKASIKKNILTWFSLIKDENKGFRAVFVTCTVVLFFMIAPPLFLLFLAYSIKEGFSLAQTGSIGDTIGGTVGPLVGIITSILTFLAFMEQLKLNREQMKQFRVQEKQFNEQLSEQDKIKKRQSFESHFFELLRIYREFVGGMEIVYDNGIKAEKGKKVFEVMYKQIKDFYDRDMIKDTDPLEKVCLWYECMYNQSIEPIKDKIQQDWVYIGQGQDHNSIQYEGLNKNYTSCSYPDVSIELPQYLRLIYHIVRYVVEYDKEVLDEKEKYEYLKSIRIQLSIYEQFILMINAFGTWGGAWIDESYLTDWRLIKNIPCWMIEGDFHIELSELYEKLKVEPNGKHNQEFIFEFAEQESEQRK